MNATIRERTRLLHRIAAFEAVVTNLVKAWDSIPFEDRVPEEINIDALWIEARKLVGIPPRDPEI